MEIKSKLDEYVVEPKYTPTNTIESELEMREYINAFRSNYIGVKERFDLIVFLTKCKKRIKFFIPNTKIKIKRWWGEL